MPKISRPTRPLADVHVLPRRDGALEVVVFFTPDPDELLASVADDRVFLALDASASLKTIYGLGGPFGVEPNYMQPVARKLGTALSAAASSGKVFAAYWSVGADGSKVEPIGEFDRADWQWVVINGPRKEKWGKATRLLPAVWLCVEQVAVGADRTLGVLVTDGIIEDEADCVAYCRRIGKEMAQGRRKPVKLVLIGIGHEVDKAQLQRFTEIFEGTGIEYQMWSYGLVASMRDEADIQAVLFGGLMTEQTIVASWGRVEDGSGTLLADFGYGLPGKFEFELPPGQTSFVIRTPDRTIIQDVSEALEECCLVEPWS
jgi:hypothetical protein